MSNSQKPKVLITAPFDPAQAEKLREQFEVTLIEPSLAGASLANMELDAQLAEADAIVAELDVIDQATRRHRHRSSVRGVHRRPRGLRGSERGRERGLRSGGIGFRIR